MNKSDPDGENTYVKWKKGINEKMSGSRNTEKREKGGEVADGEREVALVEKGLFGGRRAQINNRMIEGGNTEEVHAIQFDSLADMDKEENRIGKLQTHTNWSQTRLPRSDDHDRFPL